MKRLASTLVAAVAAYFAIELATAAPPATTYVPTNFALTTLPSYQAKDGVWRLSFTTSGDGPPILYTSSNSACSLGGGSGDNGSQVKSGDNKCWIANFGGVKPTPQVWGAKGDGTTDDTATVQAAINAMANSTLYTGPFIYKVGALTASTTINIECADRLTSGFRAKDLTGFNLLTISASHTNVRHCLFDMRTAGVQTSGTAVIMGAANSASLDDVFVDSPCVGISMNGTLPTVTNTRINNHQGTACDAIIVGNIGGAIDFHISNIAIDTCHNKFGVPACDTNSPDADILIVNTGGGTIQGISDLIHSNYPLKIFPGAGQSVTSVNLIGGYSDSGDISPCYINTNGSTALITSIVFNDWWCASANLGSGTGTDGEVIKNDGGGQVAGIHHVGTRFVNNAVNGAHVYPGVSHQRGTFTGSISGTTLTFTTGLTGVGLAVGDGITGTGVTAGTYVQAILTGTGGAGTFLVNNSQTVAAETLTATQLVSVTGVDYVGSWFCANSTASDENGHGLVIESGPDANHPLFVSITGSQFGTYCDAYAANGSAGLRALGVGSTRQGFGVFLQTPFNATVNMTGNTLQSNGIAPMNTTPLPAVGSVLRDNLGIDDTAVQIASAATVTLPAYPLIIFTGTTTISAVNGEWVGRIATWVSSSGLTLTALGGGFGQICTATTMVANQPYTAVYYLGTPCWFVK